MHRCVRRSPAAADLTPASSLFLGTRSARGGRRAGRRRAGTSTTPSVAAPLFRGRGVGGEVSLTATTVTTDPPRPVPPSRPGRRPSLPGFRAARSRWSYRPLEPQNLSHHHAGAAPALFPPATPSSNTRHRVALRLDARPLSNSLPVLSSFSLEHYPQNLDDSHGNNPLTRCFYLVRTVKPACHPSKPGHFQPTLPVRLPACWPQLNVCYRVESGHAPKRTYAPKRRRRAASSIFGCTAAW